MYEGRVEICINKAWGTITYFSRYHVAQTVCNQLGFSGQGKTRIIKDIANYCQACRIPFYAPA